MNYAKIYEQLIERAKVRKSPKVVERHHIKPKCLGGSDRARNIVKLTPEEHYTAHQLLVKMYPGNGKLIWAALAMTGTGNGKGNSRKGNKLYGWLKRAFVENQKKRKWSEETLKKIGTASKLRRGENHPSWGKKRTPEQCERIRKGILAGIAAGRKFGGWKHSEETKLRQSQLRKEAFASGKQKSTKGSKHTEEAKRKMQEHWRALKAGELGIEERDRVFKLMRENAAKGGAVKHKEKLQRLGLSPT